MASSKPKAALVGNPGSLGFEVEWDDQRDAKTADEASRGRLLAFLDDTPIWYEETNTGLRGVSWPLIELLEHLSWAWPYLRYEECDPLGLCAEPGHLRAIAEVHWQEVSRQERIAQQRELRAFDDCHNLARAFKGLWLPPLWVLRNGNDCLVASDHVHKTMSHRSVINTLSKLGDLVHDHLGNCEDTRSMAARSAWSKRGAVSGKVVLMAATGLDELHLAKVRGEEPLEAFFELEGAREPKELVAVARMTARTLEAGEISSLLDRIRGIQKSDTTALDKLSRQATKFIRGEQPFDQGHEVAHWYRHVHLGRGDEDKIDPEKELRALGVLIDQIEIAEQLDAISVWSPSRGPLVLVNGKGKHAQSEAGRRATLAHELCHLLIDRKNALPFAEVLGGRLPKGIEARARAFAAELLLPKEVAGRRFRGAKDPEEISVELRKAYGVSKEVVAWQARNSEISLDDKTRAILRQHVDENQRERY